MPHRLILTALAQREQDKTKLFESQIKANLDEHHDISLFTEQLDKFKGCDLASIRDTSVGFEGKTLLHHACKMGNMRMVRHLVAAGHKVDVYDTAVSLRTPLYQAIESGFINISSFLVQSGASLETVDIRNENALHWAARSSCRMVKSIVQASGLGYAQLQSLASATSIKLLFPEDCALNPIIKEALVSLRERGYFLIRARKT
jgi:hypothetical protein